MHDRKLEVQQPRDKALPAHAVVHQTKLPRVSHMLFCTGHANILKKVNDGSPISTFAVSGCALNFPFFICQPLCQQIEAYAQCKPDSIADLGWLLWRFMAHNSSKQAFVLQASRPAP
eukprot:634662-Prymnesium_polylepis.2